MGGPQMCYIRAQPKLNGGGVAQVVGEIAACPSARVTKKHSISCTKPAELQKATEFPQPRWVLVVFAEPCKDVTLSGHKGNNCRINVNHRIRSQQRQDAAHIVRRFLLHPRPDQV